MKKKVYYRNIESQITPEDAYLRLTRGKEGILFETSESDTGYTFICCDHYKKIETDKKAVEQIKVCLNMVSIEDTQKPYVGGAYGNISYDTIRDYEAIPEGNPKDTSIPDNTLLLTDRGMVFNHNTGERYLTMVASSQKEADTAFDEMIIKLITRYKIEDTGVINGRLTSVPSKSEYIDSVVRAKEYITTGDIFQVVISQRFTQESSMDPFDFYRKLKGINPSPYMFFLDFGTHQIIGCSPERMVSLNNEVIKTVPIAGTRKRGLTLEEDARLEVELLNDEKERAEHHMLVDLARNDVGRVSRTGSVKVTELMKVKKFSHVMHLVSLVEGRLSNSQDSYSLLGSTLPAGTLSGAPKIRAMEIIEELETVRRGYYGGAVGYINYHGEMDTCIAIRTALHINGRYIYQTGAGIVADSVPESEYAECISKGRSITKVFEEVC